MSERRTEIVVENSGLYVNGTIVSSAMMIDAYLPCLGPPSRTFSAGGPPPVGFRNNHVHAYDDIGVYLTEHHATRLIAEINLEFSLDDNDFQLANPFRGVLRINAQSFDSDSIDTLLKSPFIREDYFAGLYSGRVASTAIFVSTLRRRNRMGKRRGTRYVTKVSLCESRD